MDLASKMLKRPVKSEVRHRAVQWSLITGPVALILSLLTVFVLWPRGLNLSIRSTSPASKAGSTRRRTGAGTICSCGRRGPPHRCLPSLR